MNSAINTSSFNGAPWCFNGHAHTIFCSLLFTAPALGSERITISTPDEDFLEIDLLEKKKNHSVAVLFHGLEGSSRRYYMGQLAEQLLARNFNVVLVNFRGCGKRINCRRRFYHSGETEDLKTVFEWVCRQFPGLPVFAAGFSLGACALFNFLNKHGTRHPLRGVAAISTPFELEKGSRHLEKGLNRLYSIRFLRSLVDKLEKKRKNFPDMPVFRGSSLYEFDDRVTAPIHGFEDARDYYRRCSPFYFIDRIQTETLIIHSTRDPVCPFRLIPVKEIEQNPVLTPCFTEKGGHVGFWSLPPGWLNTTIAEYFLILRRSGFSSRKIV